MPQGRRHRPEARILVLTSYEDEAEKQEAYRAGACRYLLKDLHSRELIRVIEAPRMADSQKGGRDDELPSRGEACSKGKENRGIKWMAV